MPTAHSPRTRMDEQDLKPADHAILSVLDAGRATKGLIIDESGYSRNTVYQRLEVLQAAEHVRCVHEPTRLFELVDDPRGGTAAKDDEPASTRRETGAVSPARDALAAWDPADVDSAKAREATTATVEYLAAQDGRTPKREIIAWAADEDYFGYSESTFWGKAVSSGLSQLADAGVVDHQRNKGWRVVEKEPTD